jgi:hypothetical protein
VRRAAARENEKHLRDLERLARLEAGGAPDRPVSVASASLVEPCARSVPCPLCGGELRVLEHTAEVYEERRLRVAHMECARCGKKRPLYFRLGTTLPN